MPGTEDNPDDDDSGSFANWLNYKVWGIPGYAIVIIVFVVGAIIGHIL